MPDGTGTVGEKVAKIVEIDGVRLEIIAEKIEGEEWELCVVNELGIRSHWTSLFDTAEAAVATAEQAIESEGIKGFLDSEGFEYLLH